MNLGPIIFLTVFFLFSLLLHWYVFQGFKALLSDWESERYRTYAYNFYWLIATVIMVIILYAFVRIIVEGEIRPQIQYFLNVFLTVTATQLVFILFMLGEDIYRSAAAGVSYLSGDDAPHLPSRRKFVTQIGMAIAAIPFTGFIYGIYKGKYNFKVHRERIYFADLPDDFDGFTIVQLSDIHAGSFRDLQAVQRGIDLAKNQGADMFVFTGDLVNHKAEEIEPMLDQFKEIKAPYGQFSILGNHDYGDYVSWPSKAAKEANFAKVKKQHELMGYKLLLDEHVTISKGSSKIKLLGVENWGVGFKSKGDLSKALKGVDDKDFKILLSHDPSHWDKEVKSHPSKIQLTLSGHTHGMQFGIETPVVKWSPAQYRYPNWAGLANSMGRFLYVNRGFGYHAFSGRVGIWPEITVLELRKQQV
jgi:uncharacterized protein